MSSLIDRIGALRLTLLIATLLICPMVLFSDQEPEGIGLLTAYVAPSLVVIFFFLLLLDALMNRVFLVDATGEERSNKRLRMWLGLLAVAVLIASWTPYFKTIGEL